MKPLLIALLLFSQAATQELSSTLHSTIYGAQIAYVDEAIVFTCVVERSNSMAWTSDQYIGTGQRLSLSSGQGKGHTVTALGNAQTVAVLVNISTDAESVVTIVSELHIRVRSTYPIASVQCINGGINAATYTSFFLPDVARVTCDRQSVSAGDSVTCICVTGNSTSLAWMRNGNRLSFTSNDPLLTRQNVSESSGFAVLTENSIVNGIRVIMSNITVSVSSNDSEIILTCENVDRNMIEPIIIPTTCVENCLVNPTDQDTIPTEPGNENISSKNSCAGPIAAAVVIPVISVLVLSILSVLIIIIVIRKMIHKGFEAQLEEKKRKIENLKEEKQGLEVQIGVLTNENGQMKGRIEILRREAKRKDGLMKSKETQLQQLKNSRDEEKGIEREYIEQLQSQIKERNQNIDQLKEKIVTEKAELKRSMKKEIQEELMALKSKVNKDIEQALSVGTNVDQGQALKAMRTTLMSLKGSMDAEIGAASKNLEQKMEKEFKQTSEDKDKEIFRETEQVVAAKKEDTSSGGLVNYIKDKIPWK